MGKLLAFPGTTLPPRVRRLGRDNLYRRLAEMVGAAERAHTADNAQDEIRRLQAVTILATDILRLALARMDGETVPKGALMVEQMVKRVMDAK